MSGIYFINILDPDTGRIVIYSIDRVFAASAQAAVQKFKQSFPWRSNWKVVAQPASQDEPAAA